MGPWLDSVGIPYLAPFALAVIEGYGGWPTLARKVIELGIDASILGLGVTGVLFAGDPIRSRLGSHTAGYAEAVLLIELILVGLCLHMRTWEKWSERWRASVSLFLGLVVLIGNTEIVLRLARQ